MRRRLRNLLVAGAVAGLGLAPLAGVATAFSQWANIGEFTSVNDETGTIWIEDQMYLFDQRLIVIDVEGLPMRFDELESHSDETVTYTVRSGHPRGTIIKLEFEPEVVD